MDLQLPIILASSSPRRKKILEQMELPFVIYPAGIDEKIMPEWSPSKAAVELAQQKAQAIQKKLGAN